MILDHGTPPRAISLHRQLGSFADGRSALQEVVARPRRLFSAGASPASEVHPLAVDVLRTRFSVDTADLFPKPLDRFRGGRFDYVITVCDRTAETCPTFPGDHPRIHWSFDDPVTVNGEAQRRPLSSLPTVSPGAFESGWRFLRFTYDLTLRKNGTRCIPDRGVNLVASFVGGFVVRMSAEATKISARRRWKRKVISEHPHWRATIVGHPRSTSQPPDS